MNSQAFLLAITVGAGFTAALAAAWLLVQTRRSSYAYRQEEDRVAVAVARTNSAVAIRVDRARREIEIAKSAQLSLYEGVLELAPSPRELSPSELERVVRRVARDFETSSQALELAQESLLSSQVPGS